MKVLHISAECYPAAKAGGLGDVVGALPKYLNLIGAEASVVLPKYSLPWINNQNYEEVYRGIVRLHDQFIPFSIQKEVSDILGFPLYLVDIPGKFDRPGVYADPYGNNYGDEVSRYLSFQQAVLHWVLFMQEKPDVIHCHDHHTGLIPFMMKHGFDFQGLAHIPTIFTIHNGVYHGSFSWDQMHLLPFFDGNARGLLDWGDAINPLACAIKCCWRLTTVSPSYLNELRYNSQGLEPLLQQESFKSLGILNGIDNQVWDPKKDPHLAVHLKKDIKTYKRKSKKALLERFKVNGDLPIFTFIGRLVGEKGAELMPGAIRQFFATGRRAAFIVLGTGQQYLHDAFNQMSYEYGELFDAALEYNEGIAHRLYAGSDFLLMPSRVEPCGLNQMYAFRYGTVPVVRSVGGLIDTVPDIGLPDGRGIRFDYFSVDDLTHAIHRAFELYENRDQMIALRKSIMSLDFSWERSAGAYLELYKSIAE